MTSSVTYPEAGASDAVTAPSFLAPLCAIDGSPAAREAARQAIEIADPAADITLAAVASEMGAAISAKSWLDSRIAGRRIRAAERALARRRPDIRTKLLHGADVGAALLREARTGHDLIAVGAGGDSRMAGLLLGRTSVKIAHRSPVSVLIARRGSRTRSAERILVAVDGSGESMAAAGAAGRIAERLGSEVTIAQVQEDEQPSVLIAASLLARRPGVATATMASRGDPADALLELAGVTNATLIAMGSHGRGGLRSLGSVSERVAARAPCSVLLLRSSTLPPSD